MKKFKATLNAVEGGALAIEIPFDVKSEFGKARLPVRISLEGYSFRTTVAVYGGRYLVALRREHREAAGVVDGQVVSITFEPDTDARVVETPPDLASALGKAKNKKAKAAWEKLSYSHQKEHAEAIEDAKKPETRARRIEKTIAMLTATPAAGGRQAR
jgi:hypothetical protein